MSRIRRRGLLVLRNKPGQAERDENQLVAFGDPANAADIVPDYQPLEDMDDDRRNPVLLLLHQAVVRAVLLIGA
jgi:hypothetical protein